MLFNATKELLPIQEKVMAGEALSLEDGITLMETDDLLSLGALAQRVRQEKNGDRAFFIQNRHINPTNICATLCPLCAFGREEEDEGAYSLTLEEVEEKVLNTSQAVSEFHVVGGNNPKLGLDYYRDLLQLIKELRPGVHIQGFTAVEIDFLSQRHSLPVSRVLEILKEAGLGSLPGGGAEIFSPRVRKKIAPHKVSGQRWLEVMEAAHQQGLKTNATMLYGHFETAQERVEHLLELRNLQERTGGFQTFIPLAFHPENTAFSSLIPTTGYDDLRVLAVSRLMLNNFPHIKAFWIMIGPKLAQVSLNFGVDDLDGTVVEERITHAAGARTGQALTKKEIIRLIRRAGFRPVERDTLYRIIREY